MAPSVINVWTGKFLFNNYRQAIGIITEYTPQLLLYKQTHNITDDDIQGWPQDELKYLKNLRTEPTEDATRVAYVNALITLDRTQ